MIQIYISFDRFKSFIEKSRVPTSNDFQDLQPITNDTLTQVVVTDISPDEEHCFFISRPYAHIYFKVYRLEFSDGLILNVKVTYLFEYEYQINKHFQNMMRLLPLLKSNTGQVGLLMNSEILIRVNAVSKNHQVKHFGSPFSLAWYCLKKLNISLDNSKYFMTIS